MHFYTDGMAIPHPSLMLPCHITCLLAAHPGCECTHELLSDSDLPSTITVWGDIASEQPVRARRPALQHVLSDTGYDHVTDRYYVTRVAMLVLVLVGT